MSATTLDALEMAMGRKIALRAVDSSTEQLLEMVLEATREITRNMQSVEERLLNAVTDHMKQRIESEQARLVQCLNVVDEYLMACNSVLREGGEIRGRIVGLQERLSAFGFASVSPPDVSSFADIESIIQERIAALKSQGKL